LPQEEYPSIAMISFEFAFSMIVQNSEIDKSYPRIINNSPAVK